MTLSINKFVGTAPAGLSTTANDSTVFNNSPSEPYLQTVGVGTGEVTLGTLAQYNIDIFGDVRQYNPQDTPLLTIVSNLGGDSLSAPICNWTDDYEGSAWADIKLDDLRESTRNTATSVYMGRLAWEGVTTICSTGVNLSLAGIVTENALASGNLLSIGFDTSSDNIRGKKEDVIRKIANLLTVNGYTVETLIEGASKNYYQLTYTSGTSRRVYMAFDDLAIKCGSTYYQKHEIIVGIDKFYYNVDFSELVIVLDFDDSNIVELLDSTATNNTVLLEEVSTGSGTAFSTDYKGFYTRFSRLALIGNIYDVPAAIAEGQNFTAGGNYIYSQDGLFNYTQIFESPKYGITGTRLATKVRFRDDFQESRRRHLAIYKQRKEAAMLFGQQSMTYDTDGMPKRTMSGLFDYGLFPIRWMKNSIPDLASGVPVGTQLATWLDDIIYAINSFKQDGSNSITAVTSREVIKQLRDWNAYIGTSRGNIFGATFETVPPSSATLGLEIVEYRSNYGTIRFIEDPALNFMPTFRRSTESATAGSGRGGAPSHLFAANLNPRKLIICIDKAHVKAPVLRPDKIYGNIQTPGADMFQEAMRGESSFCLRFPRNHAVIDVS